MFVASYRHTEAGIANSRLVQMQIEGLRRREEAAKAAERQRWLREERERLRQEQQQRLHDIAEANRRITGIPYHLNYREIERRACKVFKVSIVELRGNRRHKEIVFARQFVMYWAVRLTKLSLPQIGRLMGGRDHTTVLHGKRQYPEKRAYMGRMLRVVR